MILFGVCLCSLSGCFYDVGDDFREAPTPCNTDSLSFTADILSVMDEYCNGCHDTEHAFGGIVLDTHSGVLQVSNNGSLLGAIEHNPAFSIMPPDGAKIPDCAIQQIDIWISSGAENN